MTIEPQSHGFAIRELKLMKFKRYLIWRYLENRNLKSKISCEVASLCYMLKTGNTVKVIPIVAFDHWSLFMMASASLYFSKEKELLIHVVGVTSQKLKFSIEDFFSKCDQIRRKLRIWSHLMKKFIMENFIFYAMYV